MKKIKDIINDKNSGKNEPPKKALAPCPKCNSWETTVQNGIFVCHNCGFEGG